MMLYLGLQAAVFAAWVTSSLGLIVDFLRRSRRAGATGGLGAYMADPSSRRRRMVWASLSTAMATFIAIGAIWMMGLR